MTTVKIEKIRPEGKIPTKTHNDDAAYDVYTDIGGLSEFWLEPQQVYAFGTGIRSEIPEGHWICLRDRSGLALKGVTVLAGVIDSTYRGEWKVILYNTSKKDKVKIISGDRIAQATLEKVNNVNWVEGKVDENTDRGTGGFGSTGGFSGSHLVT